MNGRRKTKVQGASRSTTFPSLRAALSPDAQFRKLIADCLSEYPICERSSKSEAARGMLRACLSPLQCHQLIIAVSFLCRRGGAAGAGPHLTKPSSSGEKARQASTCACNDDTTSLIPESDKSFVLITEQSRVMRAHAPARTQLSRS